MGWAARGWGAVSSGDLSVSGHTDDPAASRACPQRGEFHPGSTSSREETVPLSSRMNGGRMADITRSVPGGEW